jgi:hypothetical protein
MYCTFILFTSLNTVDNVRHDHDYIARNTVNMVKNTHRLGLQKLMISRYTKRTSKRKVHDPLPNVSYELTFVPICRKSSPVLQTLAHKYFTLSKCL